MNIGPKEARKRLAVGIVMLFVGAVAAVLLIRSDLSRWWRIVLFFPFWMGALGFFQDSEKT